MMANVWVTRNRRKIGTRGVTDSRTPRMFMSVRTRTPITATVSFSDNRDGGRKLNKASAPLAIEMEMVST